MPFQCTAVKMRLFEDVEVTRSTLAKTKLARQAQKLQNTQQQEAVLLRELTPHNVPASTLDSVSRQGIM